MVREYTVNASSLGGRADSHFARGDSARGEPIRTPTLGVYTAYIMCAARAAYF